MIISTIRHIEDILEYQDYLISVYEYNFPDVVDRIRSSQSIEEINSIKNDIYKLISERIEKYEKR